MNMKMFYSLSREQRGKVLIEQGAMPKTFEEQAFLVPSQFSNRKKYKVFKIYDNWRCECPDHFYRKVECKHIFAVRYWLDLRQYWNADGQFIEKDNIVPTCLYCNSLIVVKNGSRKNKGTTKIRYLCKSCKKTFIASKEFEKRQVEPKAITLTLDLYFKGLSLRKIQDTLKQFYEIEVHHETIRRWINHYMQEINNYVSQFKPEISNQWHTDEMCIKENGKWVWVWNTLDRETRFLLASTVSETRFIKDAKKHFKEAKEIAQAKPEFVITDGLNAYHSAFNKVFYSNKQDSMHIRLKDFKTKPNNNIIERLHGSLRERTKVVRGYKGHANQQVQNWKNYYNFVRKHCSLKKTPAEASNIDLELSHNKWHSLIRKSAKSTYCDSQTINR